MLNLDSSKITPELIKRILDDRESIESLEAIEAAKKLMTIDNSMTQNQQNRERIGLLILSMKIGVKMTNLSSFDEAVALLCHGFYMGLLAAEMIKVDETLENLIIK